ncbi:glycosyltransferase family 4 protein [Sphingomonas qilianensis]|uniref:Glycosyltransferase family 4 protein n=1 Tax=Sphingomonas qilianensis TaxID=1736690 RepID=A0ABU9XPF6_9SPHN
MTDLAEHFAAAGDNVTVVASRARYGETGLLPPREILAGVSIVRCWTPASRLGMVGRIAAYIAYYLSAFWHALRLAGPDAIVVVKTDPPLLSVVVGLAVRARGGRLVQWVQDLYPEIASAYGMTAADNRALRAIRNWSFHRADRLVVIGGLMAARVAAMGIPHDRITVIANWSDDIDITPAATRSPTLRAEWGIDAEAFVLEYSGNLGRAHEYDTLLSAAERLRHRAEIIFLFIGGGHMSEELSAEVGARGLTNFRFVSYQPRTRLSESLGLGDAHWISLRPAFEGLVVPSKVFGICAAARPIIAVCDPTGELPRLLPPGTACLSVAPGDGVGLADAIEMLAANPARGAAIGQAARALLDRNYRKEHAFARWHAVFESLAADRAPQVPGPRAVDRDQA